MTTYIVRIYRRKENDANLLIGVVEEVGTKGRKAFHNFHELWDILIPTKKRGHQKEKN